MDVNSAIAYVQAHWKQLLVAAFVGHAYGGTSAAKVMTIAHLLGF